MSVGYFYNQRSGTAFTGTAATSVFSGSLPVLTSGDVADQDEYEITYAGTYLNNTGAPLNVDLDLIANGVTLLRHTFYTNAASASARTMRASYDIFVNSDQTCDIDSLGSVSSDGLGMDRSWTRYAVAAPFAYSGNITLDLKATLHTGSNISTHVLTTRRIRVQKTQPILAEGITGGGGGGSVASPGNIFYQVEWTGSAYGARPALPFNPVAYLGPVEPNGVNSPGGPATIDIWIDTSGA